VCKFIFIMLRICYPCKTPRAKTLLIFRELKMLPIIFWCTKMFDFFFHISCWPAVVFYNSCNMWVTATLDSHKMLAFSPNYTELRVGKWSRFPWMIEGKSWICDWWMRWWWYEDGFDRLWQIVVWFFLCVKEEMMCDFSHDVS